MLCEVCQLLRILVWWAHSICSSTCICCTTPSSSAVPSVVPDETLTATSAAGGAGSILTRKTSRAEDDLSYFTTEYCNKHFMTYGPHQCTSCHGNTVEWSASSYVSTSPELGRHLAPNQCTSELVYACVACNHLKLFKPDDRLLVQCTRPHNLRNYHELNLVRYLRVHASLTFIFLVNQIPAIVTKTVSELYTTSLPLRHATSPLASTVRTSQPLNTRVCCCWLEHSLHMYQTTSLHYKTCCNYQHK